MFLFFYGAHSWGMAHCAEAHSSSNIAFIRVSNNGEESVTEEKAVRQYLSHFMNYRQYLSSVTYVKMERMTKSLYLTTLIPISVTLITEQVSCFISKFSHFSRPQKKGSEKIPH